MKKQIRFILRILVIYLILLILARMPFLFDNGFDPTNLLHLLAVGLLIVYRFLVFAILPVILGWWVISRIK